MLDIIQVFIKNGYDVTVYPTQNKGDASKIIYERCSDFDRVVISGGDGTLNETINGLLKIEKEKRPVIGYIPTGTSNDFASNLKIPKNMILAAEKAINGNLFNCDIGNFNELNFLYVAAFGAFTDVSYNTPQQNKNYLGHLAYLLEGVKRISSLKSYELNITSDNGDYSGDFIFGMISNTNYIAGLKTDLKLKASLNDGLFEVFMIRKPTNILGVQNIISDIMTQNFSPERFLMFKTSSAKFLFKKRAAWTLDGEFGGEHTEVKISLDNEAVSILSGF